MKWRTTWSLSIKCLDSLQNSVLFPQFLSGVFSIHSVSFPFFLSLYCYFHKNFFFSRFNDKSCIQFSSHSRESPTNIIKLITNSKLFKQLEQFTDLVCFDFIRFYLIFFTNSKSYFLKQFGSSIEFTDFKIAFAPEQKLNTHANIRFVI